MLPRGASAVRTSTMVHVGTRKQSHRLSHVVPHQIFDDMEEREREVRERGGCFARQLPHKLKFRTLQDNLYTIIHVVVVIQPTNIPLLYA
jgi:hypothetical protein